MGHVPQGGRFEGRKVYAPGEAPSLVGRSDWMEGELQSLGRECSNRFVEGKQKVTCTEGWHCHPELPSLRHSWVGMGVG